MWEDFLTIFLNISFLTQQKKILIGCSWGEIVTHEMLNVAKYLLVREYLKDTWIAAAWLLDKVALKVIVTSYESTKKYLGIPRKFNLKNSIQNSLWY